MACAPDRVAYPTVGAVAGGVDGGAIAVATQKKSAAKTVGAPETDETAGAAVAAGVNPPNATPLDEVWIDAP
jgi:hypothetical protein